MTEFIREVVRELARKCGKGRKVTVAKATYALVEDIATDEEFENFNTFLKDNNVEVKEEK